MERLFAELEGDGVVVANGVLGPGSIKEEIRFAQSGCEGKRVFGLDQALDAAKGFALCAVGLTNHKLEGLTFHRLDLAPCGANASCGAHTCCNPDPAGAVVLLYIIPMHLVGEGSCRRWACEEYVVES